MRVLAHTPGYAAPSGRFRVTAYVKSLRNFGIELSVRPPYTSPYETGRMPAKLRTFLSLVERARHLIEGRTFDATLIQREFVPGHFTFEGLSKSPRAFDVDDAVHLNAPNAMRKVASISDLVICGNSYIADYYYKYCKNITILPTPVDAATCARTQPFHEDNRAGLRIGWIGTSRNQFYLENIEQCIAVVLAANPGVKLEVCSDRPYRPRHIDAANFVFARWSPMEEKAHFQRVDIGLMPLEDSAWARGKCSFKMIQYMSHNIPVVVSPIGMNADILAQDVVGFGASTPEHWKEALVHLLENPDLRHRLGANGRRLVERQFDVSVLTPKLAESLQSIQ